MTQLRAQDYRQLFELSSVGQAQADPLMRHFLRVNRKLCALLGYPADELLATTCRDITHPDDRDRDEQAAARLAQGQLDEYAAEKRYLRKDGSILWAALHVTLIRDDRGRPCTPRSSSKTQPSASSSRRPSSRRATGWPWRSTRSAGSSTSTIS